MGGEREGRGLLAEQGSSQEHFLVGREVLGEADVEVDEEVALALGVLGQRHPLPRHHFAVTGAAN